MKMPRFIGLTLGAAVIGFFIYVGWAAYGPVIRNEISPRRYYYTVNADLSIDGKRIRMSGTTECLWVQRPVGPLITDTSHYRMIGGPVVRRLSDGSALLLWVGNLCTSRQSAAGVLFDKNPDVAITAPSGFTLATRRHWYLAHLDDAEVPKRITVYIGPDYFREKKTDVDLLHIEMQKTLSGRQTDAGAEVPWLRSSRSVGSTSGNPFLGYFARVIPREAWQQNADISRVLSSARGPIANVYSELNRAGLENASVMLTSMGYITRTTDDGHYLYLSADEPNGKWSVVLTPQTTSSLDMKWCYGEFFPWLRSASPRRLIINGRPFAADIGRAELVFEPVSGSLVNVGSLCLSPTQSFVSPD